MFAVLLRLGFFSPGGSLLGLVIMIGGVDQVFNLLQNFKSNV
jgi:hypothetical protein